MWKFTMDFFRELGDMKFNKRAFHFIAIKPDITIYYILQNGFNKLLNIDRQYP